MNNNKERLRGIARSRDKYNSVIDGRFKPKQAAVNEMHRKPYGLSEPEEETEKEEDERGTDH